MPALKVWYCPKCLGFANMRHWVGNYVVPGANKKAKERAIRLRLIRERIHRIRTQVAFAARLGGIEPNRYNHWESGVQSIPIDQAKKVLDITPGLTADWLFFGDERGLSVDILQKLKASEKD